MPKTATKTRSATTIKTVALSGAGVIIALGLGYVGLKTPLGQSVSEGFFRIAANVKLPPGYTSPGYGAPGYVPSGYTGLHPGMATNCRTNGWSMGGTTIPSQLVKSSMMKSASSSAVYWYAADAKRYVLPTYGTYRSWHPVGMECPTISELSNTDLAKISIGGNATHQPLSLIKITTDPKVYVVSSMGMIHHISSETLANQILGIGWKNRVSDVPDGFFVNYKISLPVKTADDYQALLRHHLSYNSLDKSVRAKIYRSMPIVMKQNIASTKLVNGKSMEIYKFLLTGGNVAWKQLAFSITPSNNTRVKQLKLYRGATQLTPQEVKIVDNDGNNLTGESTMAAGRQAYVMLTNEEMITGSGSVYSLRATPVISGTNTTLTVQLYSTGAEAAMGFISKPPNRPMMGIDTHPFRPDQSTDVKGSFIWSDRTEAVHSSTYPSSRDWFNEALINNLVQPQKLSS